MSEWLGHRDLCPTQWGEKCTCPCADVACPGVDRCADPDCAPAKSYLGDAEDAETEDQQN